MKKWGQCPHWLIRIFMLTGKLCCCYHLETSFQAMLQEPLLRSTEALRVGAPLNMGPLPIWFSPVESKRTESIYLQRHKSLLRISVHNRVLNGNSTPMRTWSGQELISRQFPWLHSLSNESQVSLLRIFFSHLERDGRSSGIGGGGRIGILEPCLEGGEFGRTVGSQLWERRGCGDLQTVDPCSWAWPRSNQFRSN